MKNVGCGEFEDETMMQVGRSSNFFVFFLFLSLFFDEGKGGGCSKLRACA